MTINARYDSLVQGLGQKLERLRFMLLLLLVFSLPFDLFYSSLLLMALFLATALDLNKSKLTAIPKQVWIFQAFYFLAVAGYFYSYNKSEASFLLERQLAILLLPLVLPLAITIDRKKIRLLLLTLTASCVLTLCYLFVHMVYMIEVNLKLPLFHTVFSGVFFNHQFSRPIGIHAGYLSLYVALSAFYLIQVYNQKSSLKLKSVISLCLFVLFAGLFFLASRNILIATFCVIVFVSPFYNSRKKWRYLLVSLAFAVICMFTLTNVPYLKERFFKQLLTDIKPSHDGNFINYSSAEPRFERWEGALELIKRSPLVGYGTGDEIGMLKTEYIKKNLFISYIESFNAHNQYLSYLIKNGFLGLLLFLAAFFYYFRLAIKNRDFIYLSFLILLVIGFYTENILDANKGILFFAIFNTLLGYYALANLKEQKTDKV